MTEFFFFIYSEYPETISYLWALIQIWILYFLSVFYLGYSMQHAGSQFSSGDETHMAPVFSAEKVQNPTTGPLEKSLIQINSSSHVIPANTSYHTIITLPSVLFYLQHSQVSVLDSYQHVSHRSVFQDHPILGRSF